MSRSDGEKTRARMLRAARKIVSRDGLGGLTLDKVAKAVKVTRQGVLYHFGSKAGLGQALVFEMMREETDAIIAGIHGETPVEVIKSFTEAAYDFYLEDLTRFRVLYLSMQIERLTPRELAQIDFETVYEMKGRLFGALERALLATGQLHPSVDARRTAVGALGNVIGMVCSVAGIEAMDDTMLHDPKQVTLEVAEAFGRGLSRAA